jgi:hypothetical protein
MMARATMSVTVKTSDGNMGTECMGWRGGGHEKQTSAYGDFISR